MSNESLMGDDSRLWSIEVVQAGLDDAIRLAPLFDAYRQFYAQPPDLLGAEQFLTQRLQRRESVIFLADVTERSTVSAGATGGTSPRTLAGFTQLYPSFSSISMTPMYVLNDLYVVPESRRQGIGKALLDRSRIFAAATGAASLVLQTAITNHTAQTLYESLGWLRDDLYYTYELTLP